MPASENRMRLPPFYKIYIKIYIMFFVFSTGSAQESVHTKVQKRIGCANMIIVTEAERHAA
jgi:hypothetical protein